MCKDSATSSRWLVTLQSSPQLAAPLWFESQALAAPVDQSPSARFVFGRYFNLGFWHILPDGIDHLLFLLAVLLGVRSVRALVVALSLYTLAHTASYAAATLGWLPASLPGVEIAIIASIVVAALANVPTRVPTMHQRSLVFAFGLLHGLGFANALSESGLPTEQRFASLLGFNVGVESAQLLCVVLVLPVWRLRNEPWFANWVRRPVSIAIALVGVLWLVA